MAVRRHVAAASDVVTMTDRMTLTSAPARSLRNVAFGIATHIPDVPGRLARILAEHDNR